MILSRLLLYPISIIYSLVIKVRNILFNKGLFKAVKVSANVISIGNITVGGSGKTPTVIYMIELLKSMGIKTGVLSRGYRRKTKGYLFVSDGNKIFANVADAGDEIYLAAEECKVPAAVCEKRVEGAQKLIKDAKVEAIILDDAYQHRWIYRDLNVLIFDQRFLVVSKENQQQMLPMGLMREPFKECKRADVILINRKFSPHKEIPVKISKNFGDKPVFYVGYKANSFVDIKNHTHYKLDDFIGQKSLVVCGIAKPHSFLSVLENNKIDISNKLLFTDHKDYESKEISLIRKKFYDTNSNSVITTQKDAVKLKKYSKELDDIDIYYLKIELIPEEKEKFEKLILNKLNRKK
ncbi:MAG: tetraacyldisaccharide 4'-kinase [bacterium]